MDKTLYAGALMIMNSNVQPLMPKYLVRSTLPLVGSSLPITVLCFRLGDMATPL